MGCSEYNTSMQRRRDQPEADPPFVIPAKAGILFSEAPSVAKWIPAFAGMTLEKHPPG
jgi:hypothetical protein